MSFTRIISSIDPYTGPSGAELIAVAEESCVRLLEYDSSAGLWNNTDQIGLYRFKEAKSHKMMFSTLGLLFKIRLRNSEFLDNR